MATENNDLWAVYGRYLDEYNSIVKPDWVFSITRYFLRRWVRHLGAGPAWLIVALRQWCYRNKSDWCMVGRAQLGRDIGVHEDTVSDFATKGFAPWFIESRQNYSYDQRAGRPRQDYNQYVLLMDEPLAPEDFLAVERLLAEAVAAAADPIAVVRELLRDLLVMPVPSLADHLAAAAGQILPPVRKRRAGMLEALINRPERTIADLVEMTVGELPDVCRVEIRASCSELQRRIVNPDDRYTGAQYFRLKWVPLLGHLLAWMVVALRSRCYWNSETGELRDECEVWPKTLAEELGCTPRHIKRLQGYSHADRFFQALGSGQKRPTRYRVQMQEPLIPDDQVAFRVLLAQEGQIYVNPGTGQLAMELEVGEAEKGTMAADNGHLVPDNGHLTSLGKADNGHLVPDNGHLTAQLRLPIDYLYKNRLLIDHHQHANAKNDDAVAAAVKLLLDLLGIYGSNRARILDASLAPDVLLAWVLDGLARPDMENLAGYVISQVTSGAPTPSPRFLEFAGLSPDVWELFVSVALGSDQAIPTDLQKVFERWDALYGSRLREEARHARWGEEQARRQAEIASGTDEAVQSPAGIVEQKTWQSVLGELQLRMTKATFDAWVRNTWLVSCQGDVFVVGVQDELARDWLENRLRTTVERTLVGIVGRSVEVRFVFEKSPRVQHWHSST